MLTKLILLSYMLLLAAATLASSVTPESKNTSGCPGTCGNISIDYPFGIGTRCFRTGFEIICDNATGTPTLAGTTQPVRVNLLSIKTAEARVLLPVAWECFNDSNEVYNSSDGNVHFNQADVYRISNNHNQVVVIGCNTLGYTQSQRSEGNGYYSYAYYTGCMSFCNNSNSAIDGACAGVGCCHVDIPPGLTNNNMVFEKYNHTAVLDFSPCDYAFLVDKENYTFHTADLKMSTDTMMPVWLDWAIRDNLTCDEARRVKNYACVSTNSECRDSSNGPGTSASAARATKAIPMSPMVVRTSTSVNIIRSIHAKAVVRIHWVPMNANAVVVPTVLNC